MQPAKYETKNIKLDRGNEVKLRLLDSTDEEAFFQYLSVLSTESKSRFGPHLFDRETVNTICKNPQQGMKRYIAEYNGAIVAYMLLHPGLIAADHERFSSKNLYFEESTIITYAPSVADDFQNTGLGSKMFVLMMNDIQAEGYKTVVLWGGVQAMNARAVHFYEKHGFIHHGSFWQDGKDNHDMIKEL
jgi:diamine N-acetyltransferase